MGTVEGVICGEMVRRQRLSALIGTEERDATEKHETYRSSDSSRSSEPRPVPVSGAGSGPAASREKK